MIYATTQIFDGDRLRPGAVRLEYGRFAAILEAASTDAQDLGDAIIAPGFVDLQVNGGGGVMLGAGPAPRNELAQMAAAHEALGVAAFLPTLITDTPQTTRAVIDAVATMMEGQETIAGLHLEGPHLDPVKAGAHDPARIRPMNEDDLALYCDAASGMALKITLAPESVSPEQAAQLVEAGVRVFLGHTNCSAEIALRYFEAGAKGATHLWNAMSPMTSRAPGLVGAMLSSDAYAGVIADHIHVAPQTLRASWMAAPGRIFLVSDAMACAGTEAETFSLSGREITRTAGRLTLADGTLAGADLDLLGALRGVVEVGVGLEEALIAATSLPADVMGLNAGRLVPGAKVQMISSDLASRRWLA